jgi:MGT family glycosyltransferase
VAHIVITSWGSYGDLYPYIGLGRALAARRHRVTLAVPAYYAPMVEGAGLQHAPVGPDIDPDDRHIVSRVMDPVRGPEVLIREWLMPRLEQTYRHLLDAATGADLLVSHPVTFAAPAVAQVLGLPWIATVLAPMSFFSVHDPPVLAHAPHLAALRRVGSFYGRLVRWVADRATRTWVEPASALRREHHVPGNANPLIDGQFSPWLNLAMFSPALGAPQTDWPARTQQTGFVFYNGALVMPPELDAFLDGGAPPVVFTLGSSAVNAAGRFYEESAAAARELGVRAVLMTGGVADNERVDASPDLLLVPLAPHQLLFPRASVIVHHGGVGTTGQGLRSGRPTLVVPHAHDQADNADRVARLGVSRTIRASTYRASTAARELGRILSDPAYATQAAEVGRRVSGEDGAAAAADAIEQVIRQENR